MFGPPRHNSPAGVPVDGPLRKKLLLWRGRGRHRRHRGRNTSYEAGEDDARSALRKWARSHPLDRLSVSAPTSRSRSSSSSARSSRAPAHCSQRRFIRSPTRETRSCCCWGRRQATEATIGATIRSGTVARPISGRSSSRCCCSASGGIAFDLRGLSEAARADRIQSPWIAVAILASSPIARGHLVSASRCDR